MAFDHMGWLKTADRLVALHREKSAIEDEISALQAEMAGFNSPISQPGTNWFGTDRIKDAVRSVLKSNCTRSFAPTEIRDELADRGFRLTQQNPMASIHEILSRLVKKDEVTRIPRRHGPNLYRWKNQSPGTYRWEVSRMVFPEQATEEPRRDHQADLRRSQSDAAKYSVLQQNQT